MKVSVVMPAYNAARYIEASIRSVQAQSITDWELLVVVDGSADGTLKIVQRLAEEDARVRVLINGRNLGTAKSRNRGVAEAKGDWIAFLDSDDLWRRDKLEKQLALAEREPGAALLYTACAYMDENGKPYTYILRAKPRFTYRDLLRRNLLSCSSVMVKRELMLRYPMAEGFMHEDYATWLQLLCELPCAYGVDEPLLIYRLSRKSKSGSRVKSGQMIYRSYRYVGYSVPVSVWLTLRYLPYSVNKRRKIYHSMKAV